MVTRLYLSWTGFPIAAEPQIGLQADQLREIVVFPRSVRSSLTAVSASMSYLLLGVGQKKLKSLRGALGPPLGGPQTLKRGLPPCQLAIAAANCAACRWWLARAGASVCDSPLSYSI
jgi:hypothetical protein